MLQAKMRRYLALGAAAVAVLAVAVPVALGHSSAAAPKLVGNPTKGAAVFSTTCAACHTLKAAGAVGTIGQNLDKVKPPLDESTLIKAVWCGGASVMTKAAVAKFTSQMVAYGTGALKSTQIVDVAAYVFVSTQPKGTVPKTVVNTKPTCPAG